MALALPAAIKRRFSRNFTGPEIRWCTIQRGAALVCLWFGISQMRTAETLWLRARRERAASSLSRCRWQTLLDQRYLLRNPEEPHLKVRNSNRGFFFTRARGPQTFGPSVTMETNQEKESIMKRAAGFNQLNGGGSGIPLADASEAAAGNVMKKTRILIVEDEPAMVQGLRDNFEYEGYDVISAGDGVTGLDRALTDDPD